MEFTLIKIERIQIAFPTTNGSNFELDLDLFAEIVPESSRSKVGLQQIEILLDKKTKNQSWLKLERDDALPKPVPQTN